MSISKSELRRRVQRENGTTKGEELKTAAMFRLEHKFKADIYQLLAQAAGKGRYLARKYGVSESNISRWRTRLGIKVDNPTVFKSTD